MTIHYHGTPVTPREEMLTLAGRNFCVSFADPRDVQIAHDIGQSVMLDNGAYTFWKAGGEVKSRAYFGWEGFMDWAEPWLDHPTTWAVIPDVIDGTSEDNDQLLVRWFARRMPHGKGAPVWHLHEPLERLRRLAAGYERVCFGSSGQYAQIDSDPWRRRISDAFDTIADERGRVPWVHMLRGMRLAGGHYPFASVDSVNAARNHKGSWRARSRPVSLMVAEADSRQCPALWVRTGTQLDLEEAHT